MAFIPPVIIDDDGSGQVGTIFDAAFYTDYAARINAALTGGGLVEILFANAAGAQVVALGAGYTTHIIYCGQSGVMQLAWTKAAPKNGDRVIVMARTATVTVGHNPAANPNIYNMATSAPTPIGINGSALWTCAQNAYWVLTQHEQGAWISDPYSAANFTGFGAMTWTVDAGDLVASKYLLRGKTLTYKFQIQTASIGGTVDVGLKIAPAAFGGFGPAYVGIYEALAYCYDAGPTTAYVRSSSPGLEILKSSGAAFTLGANVSYAYGGITFEVN